MSLDLDALVLPAFDDLGDLPSEAAAWDRRREFEGEVEVPGVARPLRWTADGLGVVPTGVGKAAAATTITALLAGDAVDLSGARIASIGVAGAPPSVPVGSVVVSDRIVDWDLKCRFDGAGADDGDGLAVNPYVEGQCVYDLDDGLVERALDTAQSVALMGGTDPRVLAGTNLCGDELWHGRGVAAAAEWFVDRHDAAPYRATEMEDAATAAALDRFGRLDDYCSVRGVSNHDRPTGDESARESLFGDGFEDGFAPAVENAVAVADALVSEWLN
jgi:purine nucleoside permease